MKKKLLAGVFTLIGIFAMANEKVLIDKSQEEDLEVKTITETKIEVFGCTVNITTYTYDNCGTEIGRSRYSYWSDSPSCDGLEIHIERNYTDAPCA